MTMPSAIITRPPRLDQERVRDGAVAVSPVKLRMPMIKAITVADPSHSTVAP
jgi:hypothetical protein